MIIIMRDVWSHSSYLNNRFEFVSIISLSFNLHFKLQYLTNKKLLSTCTYGLLYFGNNNNICYDGSPKSTDFLFIHITLLRKRLMSHIQMSALQWKCLAGSPTAYNPNFISLSKSASLLLSLLSNWNLVASNWKYSVKAPFPLSCMYTWNSYKS